MSKYGNRVVDGEAVPPPCPGFSPTGVHKPGPRPLRHAEEPGDVGCGILNLIVLEILKHKPVVPKDRECTLIDDGCVADLLVYIPGEERGHRGFHRGGIAHLCILVTGLERGRDRCPATHPLHAMGWCAAEELVLGPVDAAKVTLGPAMWAWISTAPAMTVLSFASITFAEELTLSTIFASFIAISFLSPLMP